MRRYVPSAFVAVLPLLVLSSAACSIDISANDSRYVDSIEKRFTPAGTPQLHLETFDGSVEVATWDRNEVLVTIERHARDKSMAERLVIDTDQQGDRISVVVRAGEGDGPWHVGRGSATARLIVTAPAHANLDLSTGDGRVDVRDVIGSIGVKTGDGSVRLAHVDGDVSVSSGDGSLELDGVMPRLAARSGDGRLVVRTSAPRFDEWNLDTGDGTVTVELPDGIGAELAASTGDGRVAVRDLPFSGASGSDDRRVASGRIGNGGGRLSIRTGDGSITVRRSADAPAPTAH